VFIFLSDGDAKNYLGDFADLENHFEEQTQSDDDWDFMN